MVKIKADFTVQDDECKDLETLGNIKSQNFISQVKKTSVIDKQMIKNDKSKFRNPISKGQQPNALKSSLIVKSDNE